MYTDYDLVIPVTDTPTPLLITASMPPENVIYRASTIPPVVAQIVPQQFGYYLVIFSVGILSTDEIQHFTFDVLRNGVPTTYGRVIVTTTGIPGTITRIANNTVDSFQAGNTIELAVSTTGPHFTATLLRPRLTVALVGGNPAP